MIDEAVEYMLKNYLSDPKVLNHTVTYNSWKNNSILSSKIKFVTLDGLKFMITGFMYDMKASDPIHITNMQNEIKHDDQFISYINSADVVLILLHIGIR